MRIFSTVVLSLSVLTLVSCPLSAQSQNRLSFDALLRQVIDRNPLLIAERTRIAAAEGKRVASASWDPPSISVAFMQAPLSSANFLSNAMEREFRVSQMIPFPGKRAAAIDAANASHRVATASVEALERALIAETKKQYAMLYAAQRRLAINEREEAIVRQILIAVRSRYSVGQAMQSDILRLESELSLLLNARISLLRSERTAETMLNTLRSADPDERFYPIEERSLPSFTVSLDTLRRRAIERRPELSAMASEREMTRADLRMAERERWPDVMIGGAWLDKREMPDTWEVMIGLSIPIAPWSSGMTSGMIDQQRAGVDRADAMYRDMANMVSFQVTDAWNGASASWSRVDRYQREILPNAERTLESLRASYQSDKADFLSLLDGFRMYQMTSMDYIMEVERYLITIAELEQSVGEEVMASW